MILLFLKENSWSRVSTYRKLQSFWSEFQSFILIPAAYKLNWYFIQTSFFYFVAVLCPFSFSCLQKKKKKFKILFPAISLFKRNGIPAFTFQTKMQQHRKMFTLNLIQSSNCCIFLYKGRNRIWIRHKKK